VVNANHNLGIRNIREHRKIFPGVHIRRTNIVGLEANLRIAKTSFKPSYCDEELTPKFPDLSEGVVPCTRVPFWKVSDRSRRFNLRKMDLLTIVCMSYLVGIRADVEIPRRFRRYFRRGEKFCFLSRGFLPKGLTKLLVDLWLKSPIEIIFNCEFIPLKKLLKNLPDVIVEKWQRHRSMIDDLSANSVMGADKYNHSDSGSTQSDEGGFDYCSYYE